MIVDNNPTLNEDDLSITVQNNIDTSEETALIINGLISLIDEDFSISDNIITLNDYDVDFVNDTIWVMYTPLQ